MGKYWEEGKFHYLQKSNLWFLMLMPGARIQLEQLYHDRRMADALEELVALKKGRQ